MAIIAISRGTFSGGEALARGVAERLEYPCLSREILLDAAREYGIPAEDLSAAVEHSPSLWERVTGGRRAYLALVQAALCERARNGRLVYHGYAGHFLLPGIAHVIRVRVIADANYRVQAASRRQGLGPKEARAYIDRVDRERRQWLRLLFDVDWEDPRLYDVVLNLSRMNLATACETVVRLTERAEFQPTAQSWQAMEDLALASRVSAALATDPRTEGVALDVEASDGMVKVTGMAPWAQIAEAIPAVVHQVAGVKEVRSDFAVLPLAYYF